MKTTSRKNLGIAREKTEYRYSVNFTATENAQCLNLFELSGVYSKSRFIKDRVFDESFRVIKIDRTLVDYYQKLSALFGQFRVIGVNYNQITVAMKSHFTEKKAVALLASRTQWWSIDPYTSVFQVGKIKGRHKKSPLSALVMRSKDD